MKIMWRMINHLYMQVIIVTSLKHSTRVVVVACSRDFPSSADAEAALRAVGKVIADSGVLTVAL